ncbi:hypothetical protein BJ322DRAFT_1105203 [Thelephora terrestris]|uniref:F-box domain-containing protein n=1 Tax=Thelephora terrestris TaxID=56493 RepID=A0A9P6HKT7_9AGAM|nr:hypothetical protein BJ322DRAFT_1105203 [Thelephora terrestris]
MSNLCIPQEICDRIVNFLHDDPETLEQCCLVSKSWVLCTQKHIFAVVKFVIPHDLEAWKNTFPDPSNSPAHHTHTLLIYCMRGTTVADVTKGGWIQTFSSVMRFEARNVNDAVLEIFLSTFHNTIKALHMGRSCTLLLQLVNLIYPLLVLRDLSLTSCDFDPGGPLTITYSNPPPLTETLGLQVSFGMTSMVHQLLDIPSGLHFRESRLISSNFACMGRLVEACSGTLEYLELLLNWRSVPGNGSTGVVLLVRLETKCIEAKQAG